MSWVSFVLGQRKHPWHVTSKTGLATSSLAMFSGMKRQKECGQRASSTNLPASLSLHPHTHITTTTHPPTHPPTCTFDVHVKKHTKILKQTGLKKNRRKTGLCVFVFTEKHGQSKLFVRKFPVGARWCKGVLKIFVCFSRERQKCMLVVPHTTTRRDTSQHTTATQPHSHENPTNPNQTKQKEREKESEREKEKGRTRDVTDPIRLGESFGSVTWAKPFTPYNLAPSSCCPVAPSGKTPRPV